MTIKEHEQELADLAIYLEAATFPATPFQLNKYMSISADPRRAFIPGEIRRIENYRGTDDVRDSLFDHLRELKAICEKHLSGHES
jgi:hypothetical protein